MTAAMPRPTASKSTALLLPAAEAMTEAITLPTLTQPQAPSLMKACGASQGKRKPPKHLSSLRQQAGAHTLAALVVEYLAKRAVANTLDAKGRDLASFVAWFVGTNHTGDMRT